MKNKRTLVRASNALKKPFLIMKLTFILTVFSVFQSFAGINGQTVSVDMKDTEIKKVLNKIERQGTFRFLFNSRLDEMKRKVDISLSNETIEVALNKLFSGTELSFKKLDNNLIAIRLGNSDELDVTVSGRITGPTGDPLNGVTVSIKGTSTGTTTNANGEYVLSVPDNAVLVYSYVGYTSQEIAVAGKTTINVNLQASTRIMDEVVVIGYGQASKRDLTGSIVKIAGKDIADKPNTNPVSSLQSKVPGLYVINNGTPGKEPDIRIRGTVSIGQVHPLYVVDGIFNDNIDYLNPNDIESIEVLKDPSSLAIFGVRGATGAIVITTKKARAGQVVVNFNTTYGFKKLVDKIKMVNASEFKTLFAEENANNNVNVNVDSAIGIGLNSNTDWIDAVTRTGAQSMSNISVSATTDRNRFNLGAGYTLDQGIIRHEQLEKWLLSFSDEFKLNKAIKVGINFNGSRINLPYGTGDNINVLDDARKVVPQISSGTKQFRVRDLYGATTDTITQDLYSQLNLGLQTSGVVNPLVYLENEWDKSINIQYRTVGSVYTEINFLKNFTLRSTVYADITSANKRKYTPTYYAYDPINNIPVVYSPTTRIQEDDNTFRKFQQDHVITYKKNFGDHNVTVTGGFTTYYSGVFNRTGKAGQASGPSAVPIPNDKRFWYVNNFFQDPTGTSATSSQSENSTVSELARLLYNYKQKYYLNASFRNDASSRLLPENRNQQFWAVGAGWDISRERFMEGQKIFDFLKLKGSVGVLGNQTAVDNLNNIIDYPAYPLLNTGSRTVFGSNVYAAATPSYIANPNLKWETVSAQEIGVELNSFQNRLHFEANYYNKTTNNLMTYVDRSQLGLPNELINGGSLRNWGEEFSAMWNQKVTNDLTVTISGNITFLHNKVVKLSDELPTGVLDATSQNNGEAISETKPGMPIAYFKGYIVTGVYQNQNDIDNSPDQSSLGPTARPGDLKYADLSGPDGKPDGKITSDDRTMIGNPTPKATYGGTLAVTYKGLNLAIDIGGVYGNQIYRTWGALESPYQRVNYAAFELNRWHGEGTSNSEPLLSQADRSNYVGSTRSIENGSYFRIRNIQLGYNFSPNLISRAGIKNLRLFANVQNLKTWKHNSGYTPEEGGSAIQFGYDFAGGAIPVVTTFGLNVTF